MSDISNIRDAKIKRMHECCDRLDRNNKQSRADWLEFGRHALDIREQYSSNNEFGQFMAREFPTKRPHDITAAMWWANESEDTHAFVEGHPAFRNVEYPRRIRAMLRTFDRIDERAATREFSVRTPSPNRPAIPSPSPAQTESSEPQKETILESPSTELHAAQPAVKEKPEDPMSTIFAFYSQAKTHTKLRHAVSHRKQRKNFERLAELIRSGALGSGNDYAIMTEKPLSAKLLFRDIPVSVSDLSGFKANAVSKFTQLLDDLPRYVELHAKVKQWETSGMKAREIDTRALRWWQTASDTMPDITKPRPVQATGPVTQPKELDLSAFKFSDAPQWLELVPEEESITVHGKQIWPPPENSGYRSMTFTQVWATVQHWENFDRILTGSAEGRGRWLLTQARTLGWMLGNRNIARLWQTIANAQKNNPDAETKIPPQRVNFAKPLPR